MKRGLMREDRVASGRHVKNRLTAAHPVARTPGIYMLAGVNSEALRGFWHPVGWASASTTPKRTVLLDTAVVVWRDGAGTADAFRDLCVHRGTALSLGQSRTTAWCAPTTAGRTPPTAGA